MYLPPAFAMTEDDARACITTTGLAQLITHDPNLGFDATVLPLLLRGDALVGHVARGNPIWQRTGPALAIFTPLDGYISPSWYPSKQEHGKVVPTWNYVTVHCHGMMRAHHDFDRIEGKAKLSQNRTAQDVEGVIASAPAPMGSAVQEWSTRRGQCAVQPPSTTSM